MKNTKIRILMTSTAITSIFITSQVQAQELEKEKVIEEITVTGIRGSLRTALDTKRNSTGIIDAISSEDIGKFPDKNVAESLQRIAGVTIQRSFGEGSDVSIRGAGAGFTKTSLNGQNVASTGWFVFEPARRSFNYTLLPSELVGNIEVYKSSQADLDEGGIGGTVIINTRKPLDMDSMSLYGSVEAQAQDDSGKIDPQFSGLFSWKNKNDTLGVLVSGVHQTRNIQRQGNEAFWEWGAGLNGFQQKRERRAMTATVQYKPTDNLDIVANIIDMQMAANNINYALWLTQGNCGWCADPATDDQKILDTAVEGPLGVAFVQVRGREATMKSRVYDLDMNYSGENYFASLQVGKTKATGGTDFETVFNDGTQQSLAGSTYDFRDGQLTWDLNNFDIATYTPDTLIMGDGAGFNRTPKVDQEIYLQADFEIDINYGLINSIKVGAKYTDHETISKSYDFIQDPNFNRNIPTTDILDGTINVGSGDWQMVKYDSKALIDLARASVIGETLQEDGYSHINEDNFSAFAMTNFEGDGFRGNFGARFVSTKAKSTYYLDSDLTSSEASYTEILPSVNIAIDAAEDIIVRATAARVLTRPQYVDMYVNPGIRGAKDILANNQLSVTGNIGLKPFISNQFDISLEYYFAPGSIASIAVFYKDVKNFITYETEHQPADYYPTIELNPEEVPHGWEIQQKINGANGDLKGFEIQYQQEFDYGLGLILNYTFLDSNTDPDQFPDANPVLTDSSKHAYNISGYYENDTVQTRLSYNYRSEYMLREVGAYGNRLHEGFGNLDFSSSWLVSDNITVNFDINNILKPDSIQMGNNQKLTPASGFTDGFPLYRYETARRITLGLSFRY